MMNTETIPQEATMHAPLYDALINLAASQPLRLHMPGHKGKLPGIFDKISTIDFTEISPTGNLYTNEGPISDAEKLYAKATGAREALFFSCGSTQGIQTMLSAAVGMGGTLILDRGCHKSVYHSMALLDISPVYLYPDLLSEHTIPAPITLKTLEDALSLHPEAQAVFLTSPSYYGVMTDISSLAEICHKYGVYLLVDQAHGAHFPFIGLSSGIQENADLCVVSAHKTLPALGSAAVLCVGEHATWSGKQLKEMSSIFATTSPSYPILASIDFARSLLEEDLKNKYNYTVHLVQKFRNKINRNTKFISLSEHENLRLDPCRLTINTAAAGLSGYEADHLLQKKNIFVEMSDDQYIVSIFTCNDTETDFQRFFSALMDLPIKQKNIPFKQEAPPVPLIRQSIRSALFGPREVISLKDAIGRISGQILAPYPPGIPIVAPGEEITEKHIAYLQKKSYNINENIWVTCHSPN